MILYIFIKKINKYNSQLCSVGLFQVHLFHIFKLILKKYFKFSDEIGIDS